MTQGKCKGGCQACRILYLIWGLKGNERDERRRGAPRIKSTGARKHEFFFLHPEQGMAGRLFAIPRRRYKSEGGESSYLLNLVVYVCF